MTASYALLADIGGTNVRFALAEPGHAAPLLMDSVRQYEAADFATLADAAMHYLHSCPPADGRVRTGVFAVAGRIDGDEVRITNHPWLISASALQHGLALERLRLVNDFSAQAMAVDLLIGDELIAIGELPWSAAVVGDRTFAVLGPGTGLGVSGLLVRDGKRIALETEGGHVSFAPGSAEESAVLQQLFAHYERVSNERLVSGRGLVNIHRALVELAGEHAPTSLRPQDITLGAARGDARCQRAIALFCAMLGAIAGDLVLTLGAWDGVFLTGGLVIKLLPALQQSEFRQRFEAKGRFSTVMAKVPTVAVMHPQAGLLGAAGFAIQDFRNLQACRD